MRIRRLCRAALLKRGEIAPRFRNRRNSLAARRCTDTSSRWSGGAAEACRSALRSFRYRSDSSAWTSCVRAFSCSTDRGWRSVVAINRIAVVELSAAARSGLESTSRSRAAPSRSPIHSSSPGGRSSTQSASRSGRSARSVARSRRTATRMSWTAHRVGALHGHRTRHGRSRRSAPRALKRRVRQGLRKPGTLLTDSRPTCSANPPLTTPPTTSWPG